MEQQVMALPADPAPAPTALAPGFRFHPTDEELVRYYLRRKVCGKPFRFEAVSEIDVYKSEPWELADYSALKTRDQEWYFFSPLDRKYCNGSRLNRATGTGYWKATGKVRPVRHRNETIGMKKTLVFYGGRAPEGRRTDWVMHEYRLTDAELERAGVVQDAFVLCRIFHKSDLGDRYAPFVDEEWDDEEDIVVPGGEAEDELPNGEEARNGGNGIDQENRSLSLVPLQIKNPDESQNLLFPYKREISEDPESSLPQSKRSKQVYPSSSYANASEDSMTTTQEHQTLTLTATSSLAPLGFPLVEPKESQQVNPFDSSNLERSIPPGYLKLISDLENGIVDVSMEREALKIEVMRAQAMINYLQSRIDSLTEENAELRRLI